VTSTPTTASRVDREDAALSLYHLLDPQVLANPYPLFHRLRREDPVHWDTYLHAWVVTRYPDVLEVLHSFSADRTPTPAQLTEMGLEQLNPIAQVMVKQMLFLDAPAHTRLRGLASKAFTPARVETLKAHIGDIVNGLLDKVQAKGRMDVIADLADPLPAIVTAEMLGVPVSDHKRLKTWSANFAEMLGNFQHNPDRAQLMLRTVEEMTSYFRDAIREIKANPREGLIHSLLTTEVDGDRLTEEEVIANAVVTMVGGQETTTNLIGNGMLTLLRYPEEMKRLRADLSLIPSAVEEMLRYESPSQHTARLAPSDRELGGKQIRKRQAVIAVMAAANRDPERFPDPDRFDIARTDNRHLAFGYAAHFCFGAPLARAEGQSAFDIMLRRLENIRLEPQSLEWRTNLGLRGLTSLHVAFGKEADSAPPGAGNHEHCEKSPIVVQTPPASAEQRAEALNYWRTKLANLPSRLELPTGRPHSTQAGFRVASQVAELSKGLVDSLRLLAQREESTLSVALLSLFNALLSRYSGQDDVVIGATVGANVVALRTDLSGDPTFRELLARVRKTVLEAYQHGQVPLQEIIREVSTESPSRSFFQAFWLPEQDASRAGLAGTSSIASGFDLAFRTVANDSDLKLTFDYNANLFDASTIQRMMDSFQVVLAAIVADPSLRLSALPLLGASERQRILVEWNNTDTVHPADKCIHQLIEAQAERTPDALAVQREREKLTYREFNERANQLARHLRKLGIGPDVPVGICLEPSLDLAIALLAVLKAEGACLPLDPAYPKDRLQFMLEDAQVPVLLCNEELVAGLVRPGTQRVSMDGIWETIAKESRNNLDPNVTPRNLAYVIYTSGSTGKPRGVLLTHSGLVNHNVAAIKLYEIQPADRVLQFSSISFDIAIEEMLPSWMAGAALILRPRNFSLAVSEFLLWAQKERLTVFNLPTAYWHELVHELSEAGGVLPETLRLVIVGGEKASASALKKWRKYAPAHVRWVNTYGPTEASVIATAYYPPPGEVPEPLPIGKPIDNVRIYILDQHLQPVPVGVAGELHIGGLGVARGYLNRPEMTAEKFIGNPFSPDPDARLYKTGDLARYLPDGQIEFVGRQDFQIKIRGFRVEPGEIEAALSRHASVREAVVIARDEGTDSKRLIAYVVAPSGSTPSAAELRRFLKKQLPEYMVPADFVFLGTLPLTPNGKLDRRALPVPQADQAPADDYVAPVDSIESQLVDIWQEILVRHPIGVRDNFFELGGHSLLALRLMRRIEQTFHRKLPLAALLEAPTIAQLAAIVRQDRWTPQWSLAVPMQLQGKRPPFFCVHGLGGAVLRFNELARHMAPDQPFYGIQPQGIDGGKPIIETVEEMAACYVKEMRKVQPEGPYYIGGYSFGGLVAFEMARQLAADNQEVGLLALLDTYPGKAKSKAVLLSTLLTLPLEQQMAYVRQKITKYRRGIRRRFDALFLPKPLKEVRRTLAHAEAIFRPQVYFGTATLFRASEKALRGLGDSENDWSKWIAGGVEIHEIDGDHGSILKDPMVGVLAENLRSCLAKAQEMTTEGQMAAQLF
jgi:amino acid adenylation domain-containing protein